MAAHSLFAPAKLLPLATALLLAPTVFAQQKTLSCAWLNKATAEGFLGEDVNMSVTHPSTRMMELPNGAQPDSTCEFAVMRAGSSAMLRIAVHTMPDRTKEFPSLVAECGASSRKLTGVGNEAIACTLGKEGHITERVIGRVRQRAFVISVTMPASSAKGDPNAQQLLQDKIQNLAEQVAGSLF